MRGDDMITLPEATAVRVAGVSARQLRHWDEMGLVSPSVVRELSPRHIVRLYDFGRAVELLVASEFIKRGVSHHQIRVVLERLRLLGYEAPLREVRFATSGNELYYQFDDGGWEGGRQPGQGVLHELIVLDHIRARVREAARPNRADVAGGVERRRGALGSTPVFVGTRIPVDTVRRYVDAGLTDARILDAFPGLAEADIQAVRMATAI